jgi:hypothetical protein
MRCPLKRGILFSQMTSGKLVQLNASLLGIVSVDGQRSAVLIPAGVTLRVISQPAADAQMVTVAWEGRRMCNLRRAWSNGAGAANYHG